MTYEEAVRTWVRQWAHKEPGVPVPAIRDGATHIGIEGCDQHRNRTYVTYLTEYGNAGQIQYNIPFSKAILEVWEIGRSGSDSEASGPEEDAPFLTGDIVRMIDTKDVYVVAENQDDKGGVKLVGEGDTWWNAHKYERVGRLPSEAEANNDNSEESKTLGKPEEPSDEGH
jgi:hypothetical protein